MKTIVKTTAKRKPKRDVFAELTEGMTALAESRQGKRTLRTQQGSSPIRPPSVQLDGR